MRPWLCPVRPLEGRSGCFSVTRVFPNPGNSVMAECKHVHFEEFFVVNVLYYCSLLECS
jgi:hypothetical protein